MSSVLGKADLHIHSKYSPDSSSSIRRIFEMADKKKLDIIAITDHNTLRGYDEARKIASEFRVRLVKGEEIETKQGHLIGLFIDQFISPQRPVNETIKEIHKQGGLALVPHPGSFFQRSISLKNLFKIYQDLDGIELFNNSSCLFGRFNNQKTVKSKFETLDLAAIGSSDAHVYDQIGTGYTVFRGRKPSDLFASIKNKNTRAKGVNDPLAHFKLLISRPKALIKKYLT